MNSTITTHYPPLLNAEQVANILNISKAMAYRLMQRNEIRTVRMGRACRVHPQDLSDYIEENRSAIHYT